MEIWLPYGQVEVAVNIRAENLEEILEPSMQKLDDRSLSERLNSIEITGKSMMILSDVTRATLKVLNSFIDLQIEKGRSKNLIIAVKKNHLKAVKKALEEKIKSLP